MCGGGSIPPEISSRRLFIPTVLLIIAIDMAFIGYGTRVRMTTFEQVRSLLYPNPPADLPSLRAALKPWTVEEYSIPPVAPERYPLARFLLPRISMLWVDARFVSDTEQIESLSMIYFASEPVDLKTGRGVGYFFSVPVAALIMVLSATGALFWYWRYPKLSAWTRNRADIMCALATVPIGLILVFATANLYLFAW